MLVRMPNLHTVKTDVRAATPRVVAVIVVVGMFVLMLLYLGLSRYYNAQEVSSLVEGRMLMGRAIHW